MMTNATSKTLKSGQTMVEYLLLLMMITAFVLVGLNTFIKRGHEVTENTFSAISAGIMGDPPKSASH